ncbi:hypothetical protein [Inconstantimicrobium mannanitabidum]|uniref:Uncharacterized protein n=1 Tax=Inconstantimicrobium mannanitabidum TaxID=1604901 RepID=A0ACB5RGT7_9CLOT|nr:hypothetical protein [Clostridium sp. TW13]GKX68287.1 hypothetical protein rsdtw13_35450 [Clostridium sp. TW13]
MEQNIQPNQSKSPLVLGILSLITWILPIVGYPVSIVGIIMSVKQMKVENNTKIKICLGLNILGVIASTGSAVFGALYAVKGM